MYKFKKITARHVAQFRKTRRVLVAQAIKEGGLASLNAAGKPNTWTEQGCSVRYFNMGGGVFGLRLRAKEGIPPNVGRLLEAADID